MRIENLIIIFLISNSTSAFAQIAKPRLLKVPTAVTPVNFAGQHAQGGIIGNSSQSITVNRGVLKTDIAKAIITVNGTTYQIGNTYPITGNDTILTNSIIIEKGRAFDIVGTIGSFTLIKFWEYDSHQQNDISLYDSYLSIGPESTTVMGLAPKRDVNITPDAAAATNRTINPSKDYYIIPTNALMASSDEFEFKKNAWNMGLLVIPAKLRPFATKSGQFDFAGGFNMGATFSWTVKHNWRTDKTFNFLGYAGVGSVNIDTIQSGLTTKPEQKNISVFSIGAGFMWERKGVQISLLTGMDFPSGATQKKWVYRNMPWIGIGFGYAIFKIQSGDGQGAKGENTK